MYASTVIGQSDFTSNSDWAGGSASGQGFLQSYGIASDGTKLVISDYSGHRALVFNKIPDKNGASADVIVGQTDFSGSSADQGGSAGPNTLDLPRGVAMAGKKLLIAEQNNNRVLVFNQIPISNNASADIVIGQPDMSSTTANNGGRSARRLSNPGLAFYDEASGKLLITDIGNNRVLIFNNFPTSNNEEANIVVGQTNFTVGSSGTTASTLKTPYAARVFNNKLFVADRDNHRVLIWNSVPTSNGVAADLVIGQSNLTSGSSNQGLSSSTAYTLSSPNDINYDGRRLFISDAGNHRILIYNSIPTSNNAGADIVLGQVNFTSNSSNQGGNPGSNTLNMGTCCADMAIIGKKLFISEQSNNRVLIFENVPDTPKAIFTSSPVQQPDGKMRFSGDVSLSGGKHSIWKIEASVNGGPFGEVTSLTDTVRTNPGIPDDIISKFYHDVVPWENDNSTKDKWTQDIGYTVRFKVYSTNVDLADPFFYFTPFTLNSVNPIGFSVNKKQINLLKDDLDHYEVHIKNNNQKTIINEPEKWTKYIDQIPISYDLARDKEDNLLKILDNTLPEGGNGIYENGNLKATYTNDSATVQVSSKLTSLSPGKYEIKVVAVDKYGYGQETLPQELIIDNPLPYRVNPHKPRVKSVFVEASPSPSTGSTSLTIFDPLRISEDKLPQPGPSPQEAMSNEGFLTPIVDFFDALFH